MAHHLPLRHACILLLRQVDRGAWHDPGVGREDDDARRVLEQARGQRRRAQLMASLISLLILCNSS